FGRRPGDPVVPDQMDVRDDEYVARVLDLIEELGGTTHEIAVMAASVAAPEPEPVGALAARRFDRAVDTAWRRTSYSGLIRVEESVTGPVGHVGSEPEVSAKEDDDLGPEVGDSGGRVASAGERI